MQQKLIETQLFRPKSLVVESKLSSNLMMVEGILATADRPNGNGRYYSKNLWEREINKYIEGPVRENRALGELDHSDSEVVNLKNASHLIKEVWWDNQNNIWGKIEILPTPAGNILKTLIENKVLVGVSSRGLGSLQEMGELLEVQDDFSLICWDFVSTPSNEGSWVKTLNEHKSYFSHVSKYQKVNRIINDIIYNL